MLLTVTLLFVCAILGGLAAIRFGYKASSLKLPLIFGGSFLFSITILHLLPDLFAMSDDPMKIGLYILLGFFLQQIFETTSNPLSGIHEMAWLPTGPSVLVNTLKWMGFEYYKVIFYKQPKNKKRGRVRIVAAREPSILTPLDTELN